MATTLAQTDTDILTSGLAVDEVTVKGLHDGITLGETEDPGPMKWRLPEGIEAVKIAPGDGATTNGGTGDDTIVADPHGPLGEKGQTPPGYENVIYGGDGDDTLIGGAGNDTLFGQDGNDWIESGSGDDLIDAGPSDGGFERLIGGDGNDSILGGSGRDIINGDGDDDWISCGADDDDAYGGAGDDIINGDGGRDRLTGNGGNDTLNGGAGSDSIYGGDGQDEMWGGSGADTFENGGTDGLFDIVHDYSDAEGDVARGHHFDVDANGHTVVYDDQGTVLLKLVGYDAFLQGIELDWP